MQVVRACGALPFFDRSKGMGNLALRSAQGFLPEASTFGRTRSACSVQSLIMCPFVGWFSFLGGHFPVGVHLSEEFRCGELVDRELCPFSFGFLFILWIVSFHTYLLESTELFVVHCSESPMILFHLPLDWPSAAAAPEAGCSSCLSREEKCFSRTFCSRYRTTIFCSLVLSRDSPT